MFHTVKCVILFVFWFECKIIIAIVKMCLNLISKFFMIDIAFLIYCLRPKYILMGKFDYLNGF